jgi:methylmalonyl-CoA mutase
METMYQRSRIQEESLYYEMLKHIGEYPIIGLNAFLSSKGSPTILPKEVIPACAEAAAGRRATEEGNEAQIRTMENPASNAGQTLGYLEEPHSGGIGLSATPSGKHFSFGHPALLLSQLPVGNFLSSRLVCPER